MYIRFLELTVQDLFVLRVGESNSFIYYTSDSEEIPVIHSKLIDHFLITVTLTGLANRSMGLVVCISSHLMCTF